MIGRYWFSTTRRLLIGAIALTGAATSGLQAAPLAPGKGHSAETHILQVRDGCGPGMRYSDRRDACVEDFDGGPRGYDDRRPPPPMYDRRPPPPEYDRRPPPPPEYYRSERPMPDCGRGMRFSNSRQGCVPVEGVVDNRGNADVAAGAVVGGAVGALIGSAIRNDSNQQIKVVRPVR
jgi:hypothetical protein